MTEQFAVKLMRESGADLFQLIEDDGKVPRDLHGKPLTPSSRETTKLRTRKTTQKEVDARVKNLSLKIEIMLDAALLAPDSRFQNVVPAIYSSLSKIIKEFELEQYYRRIMNEYELDGKEGFGRFAFHRKGKTLANRKIRANRYAERAELFMEESAKKPSLPVPGPGLGNASETFVVSPRARAGARYPPHS